MKIKDIFRWDIDKRILGYAVGIACSGFAAGMGIDMAITVNYGEIGQSIPLRIAIASILVVIGLIVANIFL